MGAIFVALLMVFFLSDTLRFVANVLLLDAAIIVVVLGLFYMFWPEQKPKATPPPPEEHISKLVDELNSVMRNPAADLELVSPEIREAFFEPMFDMLVAAAAAFACCFLVCFLVNWIEFGFRVAITVSLSVIGPISFSAIGNSKGKKQEVTAA